MANFPGQRAYTLPTDATPMMDSGPVTKNHRTGLARGGTTRDFNVKLRGIERRVDKLPKRPYP